MEVLFRSLPKVAAHSSVDRVVVIVVVVFCRGVVVDVFFRGFLDVFRGFIDVFFRGFVDDVVVRRRVGMIAELEIA